MSDLNTNNYNHVFSDTLKKATKTVISNQPEDHAHIVNDFLAVLWDAGLIELDEDMTDLEKIERGLYAAQLFLTSSVALATSEEQRTKNISVLNACLDAS